MKTCLGAAVLAAAVAGCAPLSRDGEALAPAAVAATTPPVSGNEARILVDGPATHRAMFEAIERARDHVNLQTYILEHGEIAERLAALLRRKVAQGVKANVLYDAVGSLQTPPAYFKQLTEAGVKVCAFNPIGKLDELNNRNHRKILVVDGRTAFTGGINISETYASGSLTARRKPGPDKKEGWRDTQVMVEGPVVEHFQRLFLDDWALQDCGPSQQAKYFPKLERRGDKTVRLVKADPDSGSETYTALLSAIGESKQRAWLAFGYFVPDPKTKRVLMDAARRGVDVRLVLPGFTDFWAPVAAGRSHYGELLSAGVKIYEWREALMHAKTAVVDSRWSSVGSTNLDWRSFVHNYEADLIVLDAGFAREMERRFELDVKAAVAITLEDWKKRGFGQKLKEVLARQWEYLL